MFLDHGFSLVFYVPMTRPLCALRDLSTTGERLRGQWQHWAMRGQQEEDSKSRGEPLSTGPGPTVSLWLPFPVKRIYLNLSLPLPKVKLQ